MTAMNICRVPISDLHEDVANVRLHDEKNLATIKASLLRFGQVEPLVVQRGTMRVIGGNGRLQAMRELKWEFADVYEVDLQPSEQTALGIVLNRSSELAKWDEKGLSEMLGSLKTEGFALGDLGFGDGEFAKLANGGGSGSAEGGAGKDEAPDPRPEAFSKRGDLWLLGAHRVLCGDSTKPEDVERVMGGEKAGLIATDPPYSSGGIHIGDRRLSPTEKYQQSGTKKEYVEFSGDNRDQRSWISWCSLWLGTLLGHSDLGAYLFVFSDWRQLPSLSDAIQSAGWTWRGVNVWDKGERSRMPSQAYFRQQAEFVAWGTAGKLEPKYEVGRTGLPGVLRCITDRDKDHLTQKPVEVMSWLLKIRDDGVVLDPFLGSGTTLIAADQLGRRAFGIEIEPHYVDVICRRWARLTGRVPVRDGDGVEFPVDAPVPPVARPSVDSVPAPSGVPL